MGWGKGVFWRGCGRRRRIVRLPGRARTREGRTTPMSSARRSSWCVRRAIGSSRAGSSARTDAVVAVPPIRAFTSTSVPWAPRRAHVCPRRTSDNVQTCSPCGRVRRRGEGRRCSRRRRPRTVRTLGLGRSVARMGSEALGPWGRGPPSLVAGVPSGVDGRFERTGLCFGRGGWRDSWVASSPSSSSRWAGWDRLAYALMRV